MVFIRPLIIEAKPAVGAAATERLTDAQHRRTEWEHTPDAADAFQGLPELPEGLGKTGRREGCWLSPAKAVGMKRRHRVASSATRRQ
ncbi:hypothetical protein ERJ75_000183500 [Trypanosoma vivax]|nr:hypothetical protein ERJ75_000183500 [Trypanosoma vivax]